MAIVIIEKAKPRRPAKLDKLSETAAGHVAVNLFKGIQAFKRKISRDKLIGAVEKKSLGGIVREIPWETITDDLLPGFSKLDASAQRAVEIAFEALPAPIRNEMRLDAKNPELQGLIDGRFKIFLQDLNQETHNTISRAVTRSFTHALTPDRVAKLIVNEIGLNERQALALDRYHLTLLSSKRKPETVERLVDQYSNRLLNQRAMMIARTEVQNANNNGQLAVWKNAVNNGLIERNEAYKVWVEDGNPCAMCHKMNGKKVLLHEKWHLPDGRYVNVPTEIHPRCLCLMNLEF